MGTNNGVCLPCIHLHTLCYTNPMVIICYVFISPEKKMPLILITQKHFLHLQRLKSIKHNEQNLEFFLNLKSGKFLYTGE